MIKDNKIALKGKDDKRTQTFISIKAFAYDTSNDAMKKYEISL